MTEQVTKLLKDYLEEMTDRMLTEFKWYLSQYKDKGSRPIQKSQLENTTRTETVDTLVQAYGESGAVVTMVDILYRMKLNDLATQLAQATIERNTDQQEVEEAHTEPQKLGSQKEETLKAPKDLCCPICLCIFQTPVMLQCGHSFCKVCVQHTWKGKASRKCPLCEQVISAQPQTNFSLQSLSDTYTRRPREPPRDDTCRIPPKTIRNRQDDFENVLNICRSSVELVKRQSHDTEEKIKEEFEKLRRYLNMEEATRLAALKQEEGEKISFIQMIVDLSRDTFFLSDTVSDMEELVKDSSFLMNFKSSLERTQTALLEPGPPQVQIDGAKYVENLQLRVLRKMLRIAKNLPVFPEAQVETPRPAAL